MVKKLVFKQSPLVLLGACALGVLSTYAITSVADVLAIYGQDSRKDIYDVSDAKVRGWSKSVASLVDANNVQKQSDGSLLLRNRTYKTESNLCAGTRFAEQPSVASCSAVLVGPDLLLTAKHCLARADSCAKTNFIFDYAILDATRDPLKVPVANAYTCREIVAFFPAGSAGAIETNHTEYALVRLDRKVENRAPLPIRRSGQPREGELLVSIGSTMGLPLKVATGQVMSNDPNGTTFHATVDTFTGNSGGPVINTQNGVVEGILVDGMTDLQFDSANGCYNEAKYAELDARGEIATLASVAAAHIPQLSGPGPGPAPSAGPSTEPSTTPLPIPSAHPSAHPSTTPSAGPSVTPPSPPRPVTNDRCELRMITYRVEGYKSTGAPAVTLLPSDSRKLTAPVRAWLNEVARKYKKGIPFTSSALVRVAANTFTMPASDPLCSGTADRELQIRTGPAITALHGTDRHGRPISGRTQVHPDEFYLSETFPVATP